jgi:hypothetical protein
METVAYYQKHFSNKSFNGQSPLHPPRALTIKRLILITERKESAEKGFKIAKNKYFG